MPVLSWNKYQKHARSGSPSYREQYPPRLQVKQETSPTVFLEATNDGLVLIDFSQGCYESKRGTQERIKTIALLIMGRFIMRWCRRHVRINTHFDRATIAGSSGR